MTRHDNRCRVVTDSSQGTSAGPIHEASAPVNLRASATSGVKWNFASQAGQQVSQLLTMVVLARLLPPADFGLLGMAAIVIGFISIFKDLALRLP